MFGHKMANDATSRVKKDSLAAVKSLTKKYVRTYCKAYGGDKFLFADKAEAQGFIDRYKEDMMAANGYAPKRYYWCKACGGYHVTSQAYTLRTTNVNVSVETPKNDVRQSQKSLHHKLNRIDLLICRANKALAEHRMQDARKLCDESVQLFERLDNIQGSSLRRESLMEKLKECVNCWAAENAMLQSALFRVVFNPTRLLYKQWYMQESAA